MYKIFTLLLCFISSISFGQFSGDPVFTDNTVCDGESAEVTVIYTLSASGVAHSLSWEDSGGSVVSTTSSTSSNSATSAPFTASTQVIGSAVICKLEISDVNGLNGKSYRAVVTEGTPENSAFSDVLTVNAMPTISVQPVSTSICEVFTDPALFNATVTGGTTPYDFTWHNYDLPTPNVFDSGQTSASMITGTLTFSPPGGTSQVVEVVIEDANGCKVSSDLSARINSISAPNITIQPAANSVVCPGNFVTLSVQADNATQYDWRLDGASMGINTATISVGNDGTYSVIAENNICTGTTGGHLSNDAVVTVRPQLAITSQPIVNNPSTGNNQINSGETGTVKFTATAADSRSVVWTLGGETLVSGTPTSAGTIVTIFPEVDNTSDSYTYEVELANLAAGDAGKLARATLTDECSTVNTSAIALPVEYTYFKANLVNNEVILEWETASEINNEAFFIEKSNDGIAFNEIGIREGAGNSFETLQYRFVDETPDAGVNYYRLRQMDFDGVTELSKVVSVDIEKDGAGNVLKASFDASINPTTASNEVQIALSKTFEQDLSVQIFDALGRNILNSTINAGNQQLNIDISSFPESQYFIKINNQREIVTKTFFKL